MRGHDLIEQVRLHGEPGPLCRAQRKPQQHHQHEYCQCRDQVQIEDRARTASQLFILWLQLGMAHFCYPCPGMTSIWVDITECAKPQYSRPRKNGKASCRESVCMYVMIRVVCEH